MNNLLLKSFFCLFISGGMYLTSHPLHAQNSYFFPNAQRFDESIPTPESFLGYKIGERQTRYDRVVAYMEELARKSDRVTIETIGQTYEYRPQVIVTITSPQNHGRLDRIQVDHMQLADPGQIAPSLDNMPVLVHLGGRSCPDCSYPR